MTRRTQPRRRPAWDRARKPGVFSVTGYFPIDALYPRRLTVTWDRGQLIGPDELITAARDRAAALEGQRVGPEEGPYTRTNHLASALSASIIISDLLIWGTQRYSGDVPMRPPIPAGAVG